jgi:DNA-binding CsgD family transcriptional regulator/PAS domain-containing protein
MGCRTANVTVDEFSRVVSEIYASSTSPENWSAALADIGRILGATGCAVIMRGGTTRSVMASTVPSEARDSYVAYYHTMDYVLDAVETGPAGLVRGGQALVALKANSEFDADFMRPYGMNDGLFTRLTVGTTPTTFLAPAAKGSKPFDTARRVKFMGALVPHLQQALRTQNHLEELDNRTRDITAVIDVLRHGIVIIDTGRRIAQMNSAAEKILMAGDGLYVQSDQLEALHTATNKQLQSGITRACEESPSGARGGDSLACRRPSGKRPYVIHTLPLATSDDHSTARALVMIIDPEQAVEPPKMVLRRLFGLTNSEADVALRVMRGDGLKPISADLALTPATIKTHLQHIFDKTDTHRQAELVRLLLAVIP